jgi:hypothetical protein
MLALLRKYRAVVAPLRSHFYQTRLQPTHFIPKSYSNLALKHRPDDIPGTPARELPEHAVISTFDLFSIGGAS